MLRLEEYMEVQKLYQDGVSISEIARQVGMVLRAAAPICVQDGRFCP